MTRRWFLAFLTFCALPAAAQEIVRASELEALLSGNTIRGIWSGTAYEQYFDPGGMTVYIAEGRAPEFGRWRVNPGTDMYESWWQQSSWVAYSVLRQESGYGWVRSAGQEAFTVLEGRQISW